MPTNFSGLKAFDADAVRVGVGLVEQARPADLTRPTPCAGWTLADLLAHMTAQHRGFAAAARGEGGDLGHWRVEESGPDAVARYAESAAEVVAAFGAVEDDAAEFTLPEFSPAITFPARRAVGFHFIDYVVHAWDVARTLDVPVALPDDLLAAALPIALAVPDGAGRLAEGAAFAPALAADDGLPTFDRILRTLGRAPDWSAEPV